MKMSNFVDHVINLNAYRSHYINIHLFHVILLLKIINIIKTFYLQNEESIGMFVNKLNYHNYLR